MQATAGRVANRLGIGGDCLARVQGPFVTVDFIIGEVFDYLHGRYYGARLSTRAPEGRVRCVVRSGFIHYIITPN